MVTTPLRSAMNKSTVALSLKRNVYFSRKQVAQVLEALIYAMHRHIRKGGAGEFTVPGLLKCIVKHKLLPKLVKALTIYR